MGKLSSSVRSLQTMRITLSSIVCAVLVAGTLTTAASPAHAGEVLWYWNSGDNEGHNCAQTSAPQDGVVNGNFVDQHNDGTGGQASGWAQIWNQGTDAVVRWRDSASRTFERYATWRSWYQPVAIEWHYGYDDDWDVNDGLGAGFQFHRRYRIWDPEEGSSTRPVNYVLSWVENGVRNTRTLDYDTENVGQPGYLTAQQFDYVQNFRRAVTDMRTARNHMTVQGSFAAGGSAVVNIGIGYAQAAQWEPSAIAVSCASVVAAITVIAVHFNAYLSAWRRALAAVHALSELNAPWRPYDGR